MTMTNTITPTINQATSQAEKPTFENLIEINIDILNKQRLNKINCETFKANLKTIKQIYGKEFSKEFFQREFNGTLANFCMRFNRLIKKAEIPTTERAREHKKITSKQGEVYLEKAKEILTFFVI
jgi:hypothetical protein